MFSGLQKRSNKTARGTARVAVLRAKHITATTKRTFIAFWCMKRP
jgi:hypothetical protein